MSNLKLEIISREGIIFNGDCHMAVIPSTLGDIGFMHGHEAIVALLREGEITVFDDKQNVVKQISVTGGYAKMDGAERLSVLVNEHAAS